MKNVKKIALFMIAMMLCMFMSSGIVNAAADAEDTGGSDVVLTHGADTSRWYVSGNYHYNPCKVSDCTNSGHKYNWSFHSGSPTCESSGYCYKCGTTWGSPQGHQPSGTWYQLDDTTHYQKCIWYDECGTMLNKEKHNLNQGEGIDEHLCKCGYTDGTHHAFWGDDAGCIHGLCNARLNFTETTGFDVIRSLPQFNDYYMVGYGGPDWEKEPPAIAQYTTNYTPYTSITGTDIINVTMDLGAFTHGNYAYHAGNYNDSVEKRGAPAIEWPVNNVPKKIGEWQNLRGTFPVNRTSITATYSDRTYTISNFPSGHYVIYQVHLGHNATHSTYSRLYRKGGGPCTDYTPIYAFLNVGYRDMEGNKIIGAPEDLDNKSKRVVTWLNGNTGKKFTFSPNGGSVTLDLEGLDEIGWRYKGYKYMKTLNIPENVSPTNLNGADSGTIETALGNQVHTLVFFFEPIKVTVNHINEDREKINTNKNVEYKLPEILSLAGHTCESLECEHETISEADRVPGDTAKKHNNTSLNKYLWPGYILKGWEMKQDNSSEKVFKSESYDENTTTRVATAEDKAKYGGNIPREIYQKTVEITTDVDTGERPGYRSDIILDFIYKNVYVTVNHLKYEDNTHLTSLSGNPLWYKKILNGHFFTVSSLVTQGTNILPETGDEYNISGRIIKRINITKNNKIVWEKEFEFKQSDDFKNEAVEAVNLLYYIISSNDLDSTLINEINRIGTDVEINFYYQKIPMLTIKHQDKLGNKLWPDEYVPLVAPQTPATSKDLRQWNYTYDSNVLDGTPMPAPQTPGSDVRTVMVPLNGMEDRTLIFIYKQDFPILTVQYVDEAGTPLIDPVEYNMDKESITTSAKDLSHISYEYKHFDLYVGEDRTTPLEVQGNPAPTATVNRNGNNRLLVFVYKKGTTQIDSSQLASESVVLKSNYRDGGEEYNVLRAIPTSEDLYANVITDSFLLSRVVAQTEKEGNVYVKFVQQYYKTSNTDSENAGNTAITDDKIYTTASGYTLVKVPYTYVTAKNVQLNLISRAVVKNEAIEVRENGTVKEVGQVTLTPDYGGNEPRLEYTAGGEIIFKEALDINGQSVEQYVAAGNKLATGFYNVSKQANGDIYVEYVLPDVEYTEDVDIQAVAQRYQNNPELLAKAAADAGACVSMDKLSVIRENGSEVVILTGAELPMNREYTLIQLENAKLINLNPDAPLISNNVLYKKDGIYITKTKENKDYSTTADVYYKPKQRVNPDTLLVEPINDNTTFEDSENYEVVVKTATGEILVKQKQNIPGNLVWVHTPVVNYTKIKDNSNGDKNNQWTESSKARNNPTNMKTLVLGQPFTIQIPNSGKHINETGYETNHYNYDGLHYQGNAPAKEQNGLQNLHESFAKEREIKFSFGVIYHKIIAGGEEKVYYPADTWIQLGIGSSDEFKFTIPEWEEERWRAGNNHTIETRVIAENCTSDEKLAKTEKEANKDRANYVATNKIDVKVIGEMFDLEIRGTNDPGWAALNSSLSTSKFPIGEPGQNKNPAYKYGLKLGTSVYYDITTTGWIGDTTESIKLIPKYYFVNKSGGTAFKVDLYYKQSATTAYKKLDENNPIKISTTMHQDCYRGTGYISRFAKLINPNGLFAMDAARELSNTLKLLSKYSKSMVNYSVAIQLMEKDYIRLPYSTRLAYQRAIELLPKKYDGLKTYDKDTKTIVETFPNSVDGTDYCIGHWYGAMRLPSTTVAVPAGSTPPQTPANGLKDGYIIVTLEDVLSYDDGPEEYLSYDPIRYNVEGGLDGNIDLPNDKDATVPPEGGKPFAIYELIPNKIDYEMGGTH